MKARGNFKEPFNIEWYESRSNIKAIYILAIKYE